MTNTFRDGSQVEVGMFGYESVIGVSALMGARRSLNRVYTQIAGHGYCCTVEAARREFRLGGDFQRLALGYVQAQLLQAMQSAGCNAKHTAEQRLARLAADLRGPGQHAAVSHVARISGGHAGFKPFYRLDGGRRVETRKADRVHREVIHILDARGLERGPASATASSRITSTTMQSLTLVSTAAGGSRRSGLERFGCIVESSKTPTSPRVSDQEFHASILRFRSFPRREPLYGFRGLCPKCRLAESAARRSYCFRAASRWISAADRMSRLLRKSPSCST